MRALARTSADEMRRRDRFVTGHEATFGGAPESRGDAYDQESGFRRSQEMVEGILSRLDERERRILISRHGIGGADEQTLEQLGRELGITKEPRPPDRSPRPGEASPDRAGGEARPGFRLRSRARSRRKRASVGPSLADLLRSRDSAGSVARL